MWSSCNVVFIVIRIIISSICTTVYLFTLLLLLIDRGGGDVFPDVFQAYRHSFVEKVEESLSALNHHHNGFILY